MVFEGGDHVTKNFFGPQIRIQDPKFSQFWCTTLDFSMILSVFMVKIWYFGILGGQDGSKNNFRPKIRKIWRILGRFIYITFVSVKPRKPKNSVFDCGRQNDLKTLSTKN